MRNRLVPIFLLLAAVSFGVSPAAHASATFAQAESEKGTEVENEGGDQADPGTDTGEGAEGSGGGDEAGEGGEGESSAETGAGGGEQAEAEDETGPQWTYQMSRITLVMLFLLLLAVGALYYRMVGRRQRGV